MKCFESCESGKREIFGRTRVHRSPETTYSSHFGSLNNRQVGHKNQSPLENGPGMVMYHVNSAGTCTGICISTGIRVGLHVTDLQ